MKKRILSMALAIMLLVTLMAGCGGEPAKPAAGVEVLQDVNVRKALTLAIDRDFICDEINHGTRTPATSYVGDGYADADPTKDFRAVGGDYVSRDYEANKEAAKQALADAGFPDGEGFPVLEYMYNTSAGHQAIAEAIAHDWETVLGIKVELVNQEWAVFLDTRRKGDYQIARDGWLSDYNDASSLLSLYMSGSGNNNAQYNSPDFDKAMREAMQLSGDRAAYIQKLHDAEEILMNDWAACPIFYYNQNYIVSKELKDWHEFPLGYTFLHLASKGDSKDISAWVGSPPETIDPQMNSAADGGTYLVHTSQGLYRNSWDGTGPELGDAESVEASDDGMTLTFTLRDDIKWSDGKAVTAHDYEYAWKRLVDPEVAAPYAEDMGPFILNGFEIVEGEKSPDELGVKALDDRTLEVKLADPCPFIEQVLVFTTFYPVRQDIIEEFGESWWQDHFLSNGPFKVKEFSLDEQLVMVPNENYYDADKIVPDSVTWLFLADDDIALSAFRAGEVDLLNSCPPEEIPALKAAGVFDLRPLLGTYYLDFNLNPNV